jgi:hypothetical protein
LDENSDVSDTSTECSDSLPLESEDENSSRYFNPLLENKGISLVLEYLQNSWDYFSEIIEFFEASVLDIDGEPEQAKIQDLIEEFFS